MHRNASPEYGQISERGIRRCYHGWLFDVDGTILERPGEPADRTGAEKMSRTNRWDGRQGHSSSRPARRSLDGRSFVAASGRSKRKKGLLDVIGLCRVQ